MLNQKSVHCHAHARERHRRVVSFLLEPNEHHEQYGAVHPKNLCLLKIWAAPLNLDAFVSRLGNRGLCNAAVQNEPLMGLELIWIGHRMWASSLSESSAAWAASHEREVA